MNGNSRDLYETLEDILPNEKEEIKRRAAELSSNLDDAVDTVFALSAEENTGMNIN